jgi:ankyrin repeat protein
MNGDLAGSLRCLVQGAQLNWKNPQSNFSTPIHEVVRKGLVAFADLLIQNGADINITDGNGQTPLHYCSLFNKVDCLSLLIRRGAKLDCADNSAKVCFLHLVTLTVNHKLYVLLILSFVSSWIYLDCIGFGNYECSRSLRYFTSLGYAS